MAFEVVGIGKSFVMLLELCRAEVRGVSSKTYLARSDEARDNAHHLTLSIISEKMNFDSKRE